jgi:hypothetical protein
MPGEGSAFSSQGAQGPVSLVDHLRERSLEAAGWIHGIADPRDVGTYESSPTRNRAVKLPSNEALMMGRPPTDSTVMAIADGRANSATVGLERS